METEKKQETRRPLGITILSILGVTTGVGLLVLIPVAYLTGLFEVISDLLGPQTLLIASLIFLAILGIVSGVGMWFGKKWGWWFGSFSLVYSLLLNINALFRLSSFVQEFGEPSGGINRYYLKHSLRVVFGLLLLPYYFKKNVLDYFSFTKISKFKTLLIQISISIAIFIATSLYQAAYQSHNQNENRVEFLTTEEGKQFEEELTNYFAEKEGYTINIQEGYVKGPDGREYGLINLMQTYNQVSPEKRHLVIPNHFARQELVEKQDEEISKLVSDFEKIKPLISVRIFPEDYLKVSFEKELIYRRELDGTVTMLVIDLPSAVRSVRRSEAELWEIDNDQLFEIGLLNTLINFPIRLHKQKITNKISVWLLASEAPDDVYASSHVLSLTNYPEVLGSKGTLLVIPNRQTIIAYPVEDSSAQQAAIVLTDLAERMYEDGPGSITKNLFWYYKGEFINIPYKRLSEEKFELLAPEEFGQLIGVLN